MAIASDFNDELALVDPARSFTYVSGYSDYGENEWSVDGWTVYGGSDAACEQGASEALFEMGYIFASPERIARPDTLPAGGVTLAKQQFVFPYFRLYYGYWWPGWPAYAQNRADFEHWAAVNCMNDSRIPHGHAWSSIISAIEAQDNFFSNNPTYYLGTFGNNTSTFNLDLTGQDRTALVNRVAAYCLTTLNSYNKRNFDTQDGASWTSDEVCAFTNEVLAKMHETNPLAELNIYAYGDHRRAPSFSIPSINVQVALGYSDGGIGYPALVEEWGAVAKRVDLRGYGIIASQDEWGPFDNGISNDDAFENRILSYSSFIAAGCEGLNIETTGNGIAGLVGHYTLMRFMRDGVTTHADVRDLFEQRLPGFTAETKALYEYWGTNDDNPVSIARTYDLIDALQDNELTDEIKRYWTWYRYWRVRLIGHYHEIGQTIDGVYLSRLEKLLSWAKILQATGSFMGYAFIRREANQDIINKGRPDMHYTAPTAYWSKFPMPLPAGLYDELKAEEQTKLQRPAELDDATLALCEVTPVYNSTEDAPDFFSRDPVQYCFIGPGDVTTSDGTTSYGAGLNYFEANGVVSFSGGILFMNTFPSVNIHYSDGAGHYKKRWFYLPKMVRGRPYVSSARMRFHDSIKRYDVVRNVPPFTIHMADPRKMQAGQLWIDFSQAAGGFGNLNCNPWISPIHNRALMPKALAVREGLTILSEYAG